MIAPHENYLDYRQLHNTVVKNKSVTVYYPHHPYYKNSFPVLEFYHNRIPPGYVCKVSENSTLFIPEWMTYPDAETGCLIQQTPYISFKTLLKLADYIKNVNSS